jgi:hypothetical protein
MSLFGLDFHFDVGVSGGIAIVGFIMMIVFALPDMATTPGTFGLPFWLGGLGFFAGIALKILRVGD